MLKIFLCEPIHPRALALLKTRAEVFSDPACLGRADAASAETCAWTQLSGAVPGFEGHRHTRHGHGQSGPGCGSAARCARGICPGRKRAVCGGAYRRTDPRSGAAVYLADRMLQTGEASP